MEKFKYVKPAIEHKQQLERFDRSVSDRVVQYYSFDTYSVLQQYKNIWAADNLAGIISMQKKYILCNNNTSQIHKKQVSICRFLQKITIS